MIRAVARGDFWAGVAFAALGAYIVGEARSWEYLGADGPGPGFFPFWNGAAMIVLSLSLVVRSVLGAPIDHAGDRRARRSEVARALACWAALVVAVALLRLVGFAASFALLSWFVVAVMFGKPHRQAAVVGAGGALAFWLVFDVALGVGLPAGVLFGR